jgi:hypothetical protein
MGRQDVWYSAAAGQNHTAKQDEEDEGNNCLCGDSLSPPQVGGFVAVFHMPLRMAGLWSNGH